MRIAFLNVTAMLSSDGSRLISALLKRSGHSVKSVFFARKTPFSYGDTELEQLDEILKESDLVLVNVYSAYALRAAQVTKFVHRRYPGMKVIWGGPHCISAPELSLQHADGVCFAEGDQCMMDMVSKMASGRNYADTPNMAFQINGSRVVNAVLPQTPDLDSLPYPDYDISDHFLLDGKLIPMTVRRLEENFAFFPFGTPTYYILTSRGCPHQCSYCNNCRYVKMHGRNTMRYRSIDNVIGELEGALKQMPFFTRISFGDDDFFMRSVRQLQEFSEKYKKKIGLPFSVCVSAHTFRQEKMDILLDAGLTTLQLGVQSGSQRILEEVFQRNISIAKTEQVVRRMEPYLKRNAVKLILDFIIDNPYETEDDILATYRYSIEMPWQVRLNMSALVFFPGTPIYERALQDGFIEPFREESFRFFGKKEIVYQRNYPMFLLLLCNTLFRRRLIRYVPRFVLRILGSRAVRRLASMLPASVYARAGTFLGRFS